MPFSLLFYRLFQLITLNNMLEAPKNTLLTTFTWGMAIVCAMCCVHLKDLPWRLWKKQFVPSLIQWLRGAALIAWIAMVWTSHLSISLSVLYDTFILFCFLKNLDTFDWSPNAAEDVLPSSQIEHLLCQHCLESKQPQDPPTPSYPCKSNSR